MIYEPSLYMPDWYGENAEYVRLFYLRVAVVTLADKLLDELYWISIGGE